MRFASCDSQTRLRRVNDTMMIFAVLLFALGGALFMLGAIQDYGLVIMCGLLALGCGTYVAIREMTKL